MKKIIFASLICFLSMSAITAQETATNKSAGTPNGVAHGLGAGGSVYWTWGFLYRHHFENNFGFATSLGAWFDSNRGHIGNALSLLYTVAHHEFDWSSLSDASIRVYVLGSLANVYQRRHYYYESNSVTDSLEIGAGAGPGLEFFFNRYFGLHVELPWMTFVSYDRRGLLFRHTYPHFGGGLAYYF